VKIYLIRHGDPDYDRDSLTERGHLEAEALVSYLRTEHISRIFSSPLGRARDTARYAADALGLDVAVQPWMAELDLRTEVGDHRSAWDVHGHLIRNTEYLQDITSIERVAAFPAPRIRQVITEIRQNSDHFLAGLGYRRDGGAYRVERHSEEKIAVFAHGGFGLTWISVLLEIPVPLMWSGFFLHTSSVTQILFDEREPGLATPRCLMISALPHLFAASVEPGTAGIRANYT
jgi:probable phosphoglycerate mutase